MEGRIDALIMPARVLEHVAQRRAALPRRLDDLDVVAIGEYAAFTPELAVETARNTHGPTLDTSGECVVVGGFAHQVDVVALNRELADAKRVLVAAVDERAAKNWAQHVIA